ncbi:conserved protein, unknown function [Hepatocystis sp. ex Piliocolobus tephrosceles]|nr:conserved protein, unknown function [Hepatocystis sp. ex Piliocolobus tephrosceles]
MQNIVELFMEVTNLSNKREAEEILNMCEWNLEKSKQHECDLMMKQQELYFKDFFLHLNKDIESIITNDYENHVVYNGKVVFKISSANSIMKRNTFNGIIRRNESITPYIVNPIEETGEYNNITNIDSESSSDDNELNSLEKVSSRQNVNEMGNDNEVQNVKDVQDINVEKTREDTQKEKDVQDIEGEGDGEKNEEEAKNVKDEQYPKDDTPRVQIITDTNTNEEALHNLENEKKENEYQKIESCFVNPQEKNNKMDVPNAIYTKFNDLFFNRFVMKKEEQNLYNDQIIQMNNMTQNMDETKSPNYNTEEEKRNLNNLKKQQSSLDVTINKLGSIKNNNEKNEYTTNTTLNVLSSNSQINNLNALYKSKTLSTELGTHEDINNLVNYKTSVKMRLNSSIGYVSADNDKNVNITPRTFTDAIPTNENSKSRNRSIKQSKKNIMDILNNKVNINSLNYIEHSTPKYVKYNTLHREIKNPRQQLSNPNKNPINHMVCL